VTGSLVVTAETVELVVAMAPSSPPTAPATVERPRVAREALERQLAEAVEPRTSTLTGGLVVAFSGGPDSTALLLVARRFAAPRGLPLWAVHVDHGLDRDSPRRARAAQEIAARVGAAFRCRAAQRAPRPGRSLEAEARGERYRLLDLERQRLGAAWILTAHHRQDQLETLLLRIRQGSGVRGLEGIRPRFRRVLRPLLQADREQLRAALADHPELTPVLDPTNCSLAHARNRVRHRLVPALAKQVAAPDLPALAGSVAQLASAARQQIDRRLALAVDLRCEAGEHEPSLSIGRLLELPEPLRLWSVALLSERAGEPYPPPRRAVAELLRQLESRGRARCDWAASKRLEARAGRLRILSAPSPGAPLST
jgi:tRNA(Ile)-lysidine synthase